MCNFLAPLIFFFVLAAQISMPKASAQPLSENVQKIAGNKEAGDTYIDPLSRPVQLRASRPVILNDAKFVVVAQTDWEPPQAANRLGFVAPIVLQLTITNLQKSDAMFATNNVLYLKIVNADGKEIKARKVGKDNNLPGLIALPPGASYSLCARAELRWDPKAKASELVYYDGSGSQSVFGPLQPGRYQLLVRYSVPHENRPIPTVGKPSPWVGEVVFDDLFVRLLRGETTALPPPFEQVGRTFSKPIRIQESRPVTVNDARFTLIAQVDWKPEKNANNITPLDIQLRITNLSKKDQIFHTFGTFGLRLETADGKRIMPTGGRKQMIFTRPILIPGGASYSLASEGRLPNLIHRGAELRWYPTGTNTSELVYFHGTGWVEYFGPLQPGRYKLAFGYSLRQPGYSLTRPELVMPKDAAGIWLGQVLTDWVPIDVLDR